MSQSIFKYKVSGFYIILLALFLASCSSYKKVPYLKEGKNASENNFHELYNAAAIRFQSGDIISIYINAIQEPSIAEAFNLPVQPRSGISLFEGATGFGRQTYLVNHDGEIDFPILGTLKVGGMTYKELDTFLKKKLSAYFGEAPILTIRMMNFRVSVLGEVNNPGVLTVTREKINVMEALSMAGDMTIYGERDKVMLLRELQDGTLKVIRLDLTSTEVLSSPYFYMQQNDLLYVVPNKAKAKSSDISAQTNILISLGSVLLSVASFVVILTK